MKNFKSVCRTLLLVVVAVLGTFALIAQTGKTKTIPVKSVPAGSAKKFDIAKLTRADIDSLRLSGKSNTELAALLRGKKTTKEIVTILKKTPARVSGGNNTATPPRTSTGSGSTTSPPPPPGFSAEDEADAVEMAQLLGRVTEEDLSALWEVYEIPDINTMIRILDQAGFMEAGNIVNRAAIIVAWLTTNQRLRNDHRVSGPVFPSPRWSAQSAVCTLYADKGVNPGMAFFELCVSTRRPDGSVTSPPTLLFYLETVGSPNYKLAVMSALSRGYGISEQTVLRSAMEKSDMNGRTPAQFIQSFGSRFPAEYLANMLKLNTAPDGNGGYYPAKTAAEATDLLIAAGFTRVVVAEAIRSVYQ